MLASEVGEGSGGFASSECEVYEAFEGLLGARRASRRRGRVDCAKEGPSDVSWRWCGRLRAWNGVRDAPSN